MLPETDECVEGLGRLGFDVERVLVGLDGLLGLVEHVATERAEATEGRGLLVGAALLLGLLCQDAVERLPVTEKSSEVVEAIEDGEVLGVELVESLQHGERAARIVATLVVKLGEPATIGLGDVVDARRCLLVGGDQAVPIAERFGQAIGLAAESAVFGVERPGATNRFERLDLVAAAIFPVVGDFAEDGGLLAHVFGEREALFTERDETTPVVGAFVERAKDLGDSRLELRTLEHLLERVSLHGGWGSTARFARSGRWRRCRRRGDGRGRGRAPGGRRRPCLRRLRRRRASRGDRRDRATSRSCRRRSWSASSAGASRSSISSSSRKASMAPSRSLLASRLSSAMVRSRETRSPVSKR